MEKTDAGNRLLIRFLLVLGVTFAVFLFWRGVIASAQGRERGGNGEKRYESVLIMPGDSFSSIVGKYKEKGYFSSNDFKEEMMHINNLNSEIVHTGEYVILPYYD
ncbi:MAG: hypothetical protein J6O55_05760 [Lachnospiraceae bacterium]|nr:hypothetical protein [Lachnospiraceae bacterium]